MLYFLDTINYHYRNKAVLNKSLNTSRTLANESWIMYALNMRGMYLIVAFMRVRARTTQVHYNYVHTIQPIHTLNKLKA